ncbi:hypothetical protein A3L11_00990 [Thermococcus siculi]|uniref:Uncharacterized protein n=1 Tax=Thermococcus siculi TaxID=72803 RepID=A0A2Z2MHI5_9EURY|nr:hypothetical protein [Thermococcus siculi]ASJ07872.1 hypothetical protein A3L11_00990 [Thermococcus siculi]
MELRVPYIIFETRTGEYGIDAYFSLRVERPERRATLIRKAVDLERVNGKPQGVLLDLGSVEGYLTSLFLTLYDLSGERFNERTRHMRRWSIWRIIGIPTGHQRHIERDEELAKKNREALLALAIVRKVLGIKSPTELERAMVVPKGYAVLELEISGNEVGDPVYRELFKMDSNAGMALQWLKLKMDKRGCQALP